MKHYLIPTLLLTIATPAWATAGSIEGDVWQAGRTPLSNATVKLMDSQNTPLFTATTAANGRYEFHNLVPGSYLITVMQNQAILASTTVNISADETQHADLNIDNNAGLHVLIGSGNAQFANSVSQRTGTSAYKLTPETLKSLTQGDDTSVDKVLLQAPGVAQDSAASGNLHVRGEHANLQYRINGLMLPDGVDGFGNIIDTHAVQSATLFDGTLPAEFGFRTAAVMDITTKGGEQDGGTFSMNGGSHGTLQPSVTYGGSGNGMDYFASVSHLSTDLGIENPTSSSSAIHDHLDRDSQFMYGSAPLDGQQRIDVLAGNAISFYQIPNNPNQDTGGYTLNGRNTFDSRALNERQFESNQFMAMAWQGATDDVSAQVTPFIRHSEVHYRPDITGDLLFNGVATDSKRSVLTTGLQNQTTWKYDFEHTLRAGFTAENEHADSNSTSNAFLTDAAGTPRTDSLGNNIVSSPLVSSHLKDGQLYGLYLQDEWRLTPTLTLNYGVRFDDMEEYVSASQLSPRLNLVYKPFAGTTLHAGYARYFTPPPLELLSGNDINLYANTTNAPEVTQNGAVKPERSHNFDVGVSQKVGDGWQFGLDGYYKLVHNLLDEGQFGQALILTPFNYEHGYIYGAEFTAAYDREAFHAYGNLAFSRAMGENIVSSQYNFGADELAYISSHYVHLDHDQTFTGSGGANYDIRKGTNAGIETHYGSGLRSGFANTGHLPAYITFDLSVTQTLDLLPRRETSLRFSVVNVLDRAYELRDGSGIGVGAPQWGARRGFFAAIEQKF